MGWVGADILATNPISEMSQHEVASISDWSDMVSPDQPVILGYCTIMGEGYACTEPDHWPTPDPDEEPSDG